MSRLAVKNTLNDFSNILYVSEWYWFIETQPKSNNEFLKTYQIFF